MTRRLTESAVDLRAATKEGLGQFLSSVTATDKEITEKLHAEYAKQRVDIETQRAKLQSEIELQAANGDSVKHPVDDVAAFLSRVNRIRLGEGDVEMDAEGGGHAKKKG